MSKRPQNIHRKRELIYLLEAAQLNQTSFSARVGFSSQNVNHFILGYNNSRNVARAFARLSPEAAETVSRITGFTVEKLLEESPAEVRTIDSPAESRSHRGDKSVAPTGGDQSPAPVKQEDAA